MRQLAWLNATPERAKHDKSDTPLLSRLAKLRALRKDDKYMPEMPEVRAEHVLGHFFEIGPVMAGGMGPVPITQQEIAAWQSNVGIELRPWEARVLRGLSSEYITELHKSEDANRPAPWEGVRATMTAHSVKEYLEGLAKL